MITDAKESVALSLQISKLNDYPHATFALTGSRKHGGARIDSDYDFYTENTADTRVYLESIGFFELETPMNLEEMYPDDPNVARVYRWQSGPYRIDVQLVDDFQKKSMIEEVIYKHHVTLGLDKNQVRRVWKAMYALLAQTLD